MRKIFFFVLILAAAACGSSTAPSKSGDPSLLFTNNLDSSWVYITWQDGQGIVGKDSIAPRTASQCVRFLAQPDSAYWQITAHEYGAASNVTAPYFNPSDRPAWNVVVTPDPQHGSPQIRATLTDVAC